MAISTQTCRPRRRWCQFSLRSLMIALTLATVGFGWVHFMRQRAQTNRQRVAATAAAVGAIEKVDGSLLIADYKRRSPTWLEEFFDDPGSVDDPVRVFKVRFVSLSDDNFTDDKLTDADLKPLEELTTITELHLSSDKLTDAGLEHLKNLSHLESLGLVNGTFTDAGIEHLKDLTNLRVLYIRFATISDAGLEHLHGLTKLEVLAFNEAGVTEEGLKKLKQALPNCEINSHLDR